MAMNKIILIGMKSSGKTTTGKALSRKLGIEFIDMDAEIEKNHFEQKHEKLWFREIFKKYGREYFRSLETSSLKKLSTNLKEESFVLATGGGLPLNEDNQRTLQELGTVVFLDVKQEVLLPRIISGGIPAFFPYPDDPEKSLAELLEVRRPIYMKVANITVKCSTETQQCLADTIITKLEEHHDEN